MEAYRFETTVKDNGIIQIPEIARLARQRVEVIVMVSPVFERETEKAYVIDRFLDKWRGFLKDTDPDELKSQYLQEKYGVYSAVQIYSPESFLRSYHQGA